MIASVSVKHQMLAINEIQLGKRHRVDLGDIKALAESISAVGLLHPVVIRPDKCLVSGERRLAAVKSLGWKEVPIFCVSGLEQAASLMRAEADENICRKDFAPSEAVRIGAAMEDLFRKEAKQAQSEGGKKGKPSKGSKSFTSFQQDHAKRTDAKIGGMVGMSHVSYGRAKEVVASGDKKLIDEMNRTGKVNGAYKKLKVAQAAKDIAKEPPPLPTGPFRVIAADPPWQYSNRAEDTSHRAANPFPTMTVDEIAAMNVKAIAGKDCVLWLWVTNAFLPDVWPIVEAWGFEYKTMLTWVKDKMGTGDWLRGKTEHCLMCVRGKPTIVLTNQTTVIEGPLLKHSQKPESFYEMVEKLCPGSKIEMFQRKPRQGWTGHGNEVSEAMEY